jgi:hypothetical protein
MIKRILEDKVLYFSEKYPVITITGPRFSLPWQTMQVLA